MTTWAEIAANWRELLTRAEENLYRAVFPLASTCLVTFMAAALTLKDDDTLFHLLGGELNLVVPAFIFALILRVVAATPPKRIPDRVGIGIAYMGTVILLVGSLINVGSELHARANVHSALVEWKACVKKADVAIEAAQKDFDEAHGDAKRCLMQLQSDQFSLDLAVRKKELNSTSAEALRKQIGKRCDKSLAEMKAARERIKGIKRCELPPRFNAVAPEAEAETCLLPRSG